MEAIFYQGMNIMIDHTPSGAIAAGEVVVVNGSCRIAHSPIPANTLGSLGICGVYKVVKDGEGAVTFSDGDNVFWSAGSNLATATSSDTWLGVCVEDASATDTTVKVLVFPAGSLFDGNLAASGTLTVTGNATFGGTVGITGNVAVNTNKFTVAAASGNTVIAGTLAVTGAVALTSTLTYKSVNSAKTGDYTVLATDSGTTFSTTGAAGTVVFSLPAATVGLKYRFHVGAAQELRIDPNGTETISLPSTGVAGGAGKYLTANAAGETVDIECVVAGTWAVFGYTGTWTAEP